MRLFAYHIMCLGVFVVNEQVLLCLVYVTFLHAVQHYNVARDRCLHTHTQELFNEYVNIMQYSTIMSHAIDAYM